MPSFHGDDQSSENVDMSTFLMIDFIHYRFIEFHKAHCVWALFTLYFIYVIVYIHLLCSTYLINPITYD